MEDREDFDLTSEDLLRGLEGVARRGGSDCRRGRGKSWSSSLEVPESSAWGGSDINE